jgi:predicted DNA-binding transcriptional regulator AlpA
MKSQLSTAEVTSLVQAGYGPHTPQLLKRREVQAMFGGIHAATLYRHIRNGVIAPPVKVGSLSRWLRTECEASLASMIGRRS